MRLVESLPSRADVVSWLLAYYAYCVYGKSTRSDDKETEPLMPVATLTPMT